MRLLGEWKAFRGRRRRHEQGWRVLTAVAGRRGSVGRRCHLVHIFAEQPRGVNWSEVPRIALHRDRQIASTVTTANAPAFRAVSEGRPSNRRNTVLPTTSPSSVCGNRATNRRDGYPKVTQDDTSKNKTGRRAIYPKRLPPARSPGFPKNKPTTGRGGSLRSRQDRFEQCARISQRLDRRVKKAKLMMLAAGVAASAGSRKFCGIRIRNQLRPSVGHARRSSAAESQTSRTAKDH